MKNQDKQPNIDLVMITKKIKALQDQNNQTVSFVIHDDGSGCFEDLWSEEQIIEFHNQDELMSILITEQ